MLSTRYGRWRQSVGGYNETPSPIGDPGLVKLGFAPVCNTTDRCETKDTRPRDGLFDETTRDMILMKYHDHGGFQLNLIMVK